MPDSSKRFPLWPALIFVSGLPRILSAFLLPNAFGDAYAYIKDIGTMSARISSGTFSLTNLYGFWLPLYQFICAILSIPFGHPYYVGKLVSALFGVGVCLLVYDTALRLTAHRTASLLAFALIALSPLHIVNSASAMTDVPHAFFVLASACFVLRKRWTWAALLAALAGLTRMDSWMLILLIPALQFLEERRISIVACMTLLFPPLFWFYISWKATGDWLACFVERKQYMDWLLTVNPSLATFSLNGVTRDTFALLLSTDLAVLFACFLAVWLVARRMLSSAAGRNSETLRSVLALNLFFFAYLGFIVLAYLTHKQPIIFHRYGLILFALGIPILPWTFLNLTRGKPRLARRLLIAIICVCLLNASIQLGYAVGYVNREHALGAIADYLRSQFRPRPNACIFNDDGTVLALSGISPESFCSSADAPVEREAFLAYLKEKNVEYLVCVKNQISTPARLFPEITQGTGNEIFRPVMHSSSKFLTADIWLYQVHVP
ncbi:MAG TPA: phospholipid carrier-dependent glycosyltransferase [Pyrinomonadaceae bacterium]